jgi:ligand-binding sensor domain-containing protein/two-component sensor histidine kinase
MLVLALWATFGLLGQQLPIRSFSASDGLPGGVISRITRDSHGFLWLSSAEGASRFDGYAFVRFGVETGLASQTIRDLLQTRDGCFWFATNEGLWRVDPSASGNPLDAKRFKKVSAPSGSPAVTCLLEDRAGVLWCGTTVGLFRVDQTPGQESLQPVDLGLPRKLFDDPIVSALADRADGGLWVGAGSGLYVLKPDGAALRFTEAEGLPDAHLRALATLRDGTLWVATRKGISRLRLAAGDSRLETVAHFTTSEGLASADALALLLSGEDRVTVGTAAGLSVLEHGVIQNHGPAQGVYGPVFSLAEGVNGDLWLGNDRGVQRWARDGLTTYTQAEGLSDPRVDSILEDQSGTLVAVKAGLGTLWLHSLRGHRFQAGKARVSAPGWGWNQRLLQDHLGAWWVATGQGLCRFDRVKRAAELSGLRPVHTYKVAAVAGADDVFAVFEDSRGDIWFSVASPVTNGLGRWRRGEDRIEGFHEQDGLPRLFDQLPTAFAEDRAGNVWIAFNGAGLARFRNGRFDFFGPEAGVPAGWIRSLMLDSAGRLWLACAVGGVGLVEAPASDRPSIRTLTTAQGLASNAIWSLVEDGWGRIYVGTGAGIDRLDADGGRVRHLSEAQGLAPGIPRAAFRDRAGALWFGLSGGLSRYLPSAPKPALPPQIYLIGLRVAGTPMTLPESGTREWELPDLPPSQNRIQVDFTSPGGLGDHAIRYQYRLEGVSDDWTPPGLLRSVDFANLAPGRYHFQVRAEAADGTNSNPPAELRFTVLAPVWLRGWFLVLVSGVLMGLVWLTYRTRLKHLLEVERIRTRIAADLHDDIGASLSRIAILSEVVKRQTPEGQPETARFLGEIAESARELVDSMGDIVWSIDPRRDDLHHLLARVGQFAAGALAAKGIRWTMDTPPESARIKLSPEQRRGTFLILKEAINNALKHSGCRAVNLQVEVSHGLVIAQVRDDGSGMPPEPPGPESTGSRRGRGLINMYVRAKEVGGRLEIVSGPEGTVIRIELPHRPARGA